MNPTSLKAAICIKLAAILCLVAPAAHAGVVYIDLLTTTQSATSSNSITTNTVATGATSVGGFRTITLSSTNNDLPEESSLLRVRTNAAVPRIELDSRTDASADFTIKWGGAGGTAGLGGIDFRDGIAATNFSLLQSSLNFSLRGADVATPFTWQFTDTTNGIATYSSTFPIHSSTNPALPYAVSLASFAGGNAINWSSINFISLSVVGSPSLNMSFGAPFSVTATPVPEPGTWAAAGLLVLTAFYIRRRRMRATTEEAPAAA